LKTLAALVAAAVAGAASAQALQDVTQVSAESRSVDVGAQLSQPLTNARMQADMEVKPQLDAGQPSSVDRSAQAPSQLSARTRNTQPPPPLSHPSDGRIVAIDRVEGSDRCDPAAAAPRKAPECKKILETRAGEYAHVRPPELTPEQRLLIDEEVRASDTTVADASRRLAMTGEADDSPASLAIASIVLAAPASPPQPKKDEDPTANAAVDAVIQLVTQAPHN
jgi:hypothetical protein